MALSFEYNGILLLYTDEMLMKLDDVQTVMAILINDYAYSPFGS